jgi:hypothetical protein
MIAGVRQRAAVWLFLVSGDLDGRNTRTAVKRTLHSERYISAESSEHDG